MLLNLLPWIILGCVVFLSMSTLVIAFQYFVRWNNEALIAAVYLCLGWMFTGCFLTVLLVTDCPGQ